VSVLPDNGLMQVEVNGKKAGEFAIASPFSFTPQSIAVSGQLLRPGRNSVRLSARQHHRVDCSLDATYELWTRIDPAASGFRTASGPRFAKFDDLRSVGRLESGATELRLVLPASATADQLNDAAPVVQALALYLGRENLLVTVADRPGEGPGIDLVVAARPEQASAFATLPQFAGTQPGISIHAGSDPARATVIMRADGPQDLARRLVEAVRGPMSAGFKESHAAAPFGVITAHDDQQFTLKDLGFRSTSFAGRLMRTHFEVVMPADFYPAEYATLDLTLNGATAPGLDPASQMLVRVNDRVVNSFPFRNTDGQNFNGKLIELPLRAFRPGVNRIEMLAELPNGADKACDPAQRDDARPRYILLGETAFSVPPLARVTRLPDLAAFAGNAYPYASGKPFGIYLADPGAHSASAALTLLARLALTAGQPLKSEILTGLPPAADHKDALVIASESPNEPVAENRPADKTFRVDEQAAELMKSDLIATASVPDIPVSHDAAEDQLIRAFEDSAAGNGAERSLTARFKSFVSSMAARFGSWLSYEDHANSYNIREDALLSIVQKPAAGETGTVTTIRAATPEDLAKGVRRLMDDAVWRNLNGGAAIIEAKTLDLVNLPAGHQTFIEVTDQSIGNYRRIAAAWLSDNFQFYVAVVILLIGFFGAFVGRRIAFVGTRTSK
jgi:hypothetical protein